MKPKITINWSKYFRPFPYQEKIWYALHKGCRRFAWFVHRSGGKDWLFLNWTAKRAVKVPGLYWHILPYYTWAKNVAWKNSTNEGSSYRSAFPGWKDPGVYYQDGKPVECIVEHSNDQEMRLNILGGATWQCMGSDKPDKLRGPNPVQHVHSEYAWGSEEQRKILLPKFASNKRQIEAYITTPNGQNHAYKLKLIAEADPWHEHDNPTGWFSQVITIDDSRDFDGKPIISEEFVRDLIEKEGKSEEYVNAEFYCRFDTPVQGSFFGDLILHVQKKGWIGEFEYNPDRFVYTAWDFGRDGTCVLFFQIMPNGTVVFIDVVYEAQKDDIAYFFNEVHRRPYVYDKHFGPHDLKQNNIFQDRTRLRKAKDHKINFTVIPKCTNKQDDVEKARSLLYKSRFNVNAGENILVRGLTEYRKKRMGELVDHNGEPLYSREAVHDWASHIADAFMCAANGVRKLERSVFKKKKPRTHARQEFVYHGQETSKPIPQWKRR